MRCATLAFVVAVFTGVSSASGQNATLRYRWVKGDEIRYRISQQSTTTMTGLPGLGEMTVEQAMVQIVRMAVQDVGSDGSATLRETFESIHLEQSSPIGRTVFDSASPDKPADPSVATLTAVMSSMIGESVTVVIAPDGATGKVEGMSAIFDKFMKALPPGPATAAAVEQLKGALSDATIRATFEQGFGTFPDRPLKTGETWASQSEMTNPLFGKMTVARTYTLKSLDTRGGASIARIAVSVAMTQTGPGTAAIPGVSTRIESSTSTGEIVFDTTRGRVQQTSFKNEAPMTLSLPSAGGEAANAKGLVRSTLTMELVEK